MRGQERKETGRERVAVRERETPEGERRRKKIEEN